MATTKALRKKQYAIRAGGENKKTTFPLARRTLANVLSLRRAQAMAKRYGVQARLTIVERYGLDDLVVKRETTGSEVMITLKAAELDEGAFMAEVAPLLCPLAWEEGDPITDVDVEIFEEALADFLELMSSRNPRRSNS